MFEYLEGRVPKIIDEDGYKQFAVMVALVQRKDGVHVVFEKRANDLKRQPGEICLPGGAREVGESALENAVRETMEELLVSREQLRVIAQMDTMFTPYQTRIDVFLCELSDYQISFSKDEVEEIFTVPLSFFIEQPAESYEVICCQEPSKDFPYDKIPNGKNYPWAKGVRKIYFYDYQGRTIWGLTAAILHGVVTTIKKEKNQGGPVCS